MRNIALSIASVLLLLLVVAGADRIYGRWLMPETAHLNYPPFSRAHHRSAEFDLTVRINNLGFRGQNTTIVKPRKRVLVIGDSFTFGWGVEVSETWVQLLQDRYPELEILNLGQGGTHPGDHVQLARKAIPLLKPDLVMVCVLQGNDLHQLMRVMAYERGTYSPSIPVSGELESSNFLQTLSGRLLPNLSQRFPPMVEIDERWGREATAIRASFSMDEQTRYALLDTEVRTAFESAQLNPSLIFEALHHPDAFRAAVDTSDSLLRDAVIRLGDHLKELKEIGAAHGAQMLAVSLPNRPYGCGEGMADLSKLGFDVDGCDTLDADLPFVQGASKPEVTYITMPKDALPSASAYFPFDGHWNALGHRIFAASLIPQLDTLKQWNSLQTSGNL